MFVNEFFKNEIQKTVKKMVNFDENVGQNINNTGYINETH